MSLQWPEDSPVWFPIIYLTFFFYCLPFLFFCSNHAALAFLFFFENPEHDHRSELWVCCFIYSEYSSPRWPQKASSPSVVCITFSVKCCLPILDETVFHLPCLQCLFLFPAFLHRIYHIQMLWNINNLTVVYYHPPHPSGNVNSTRQGFLVVLLSADSQHLEFTWNMTDSQ